MGGFVVLIKVQKGLVKKTKTKTKMLYLRLLTALNNI